MKKHCDEKGNQLENNLTMRQTTGIKDLKTKMKAEDLVCIETNKTGKFALDTKENYMKKIQKHISKYKIVAPRLKTDSINMLNMLPKSLWLVKILVSINMLRVR